MHLQKRMRVKTLFARMYIHLMNPSLNALCRVVANQIPGQEYNFFDDWGEQMTEKSSSIVVILNWKTAIAKVLDLSHDYCYGNVIW